MYITRQNQSEIYTSFETSKISAILGPRRVGKSTLVQRYMIENPQKKWVALNMDSRSLRQRVEREELRQIIEEGSLQKISPHNTISVAIDEAQKCPALFEQIKIIYDQFKDQQAIKFILTGSGALSLHQLSSESLAGRIELHHLREFNLKETAALLNEPNTPPSASLIESLFEPFNFANIKQIIDGLLPWQPALQKALTHELLWGGLPEILTLQSDNDRLFYLNNYLQTYLEKDVRDIATIADLSLYQKLMEIIAEQTGSIREDKKIVDALGCSRDTLKKYRSYLESTLVYREMYPFIGSSLRRLVKSPKGYLNNNGLISAITGVHDLKILQATGTIGHRFENWLFKEWQIALDRAPQKSQISYWRTSGGIEIDFVVQKNPVVIPIEATFGDKPNGKKIRNLTHFLRDEKKAPYGLYVYNGPLSYDASKRILFMPAWAIG